MRDKKTIQLVGLLILIFFAVEYLEPSAVGVRIGPTPSSNQSSGQEKSPSADGIGIIAPHAMIWNSPILINKNFSHHKFQNPPEYFFCKLLSKEIFHPPLLSA